MGELWIGRIRTMTDESAFAEAVFTEEGFIKDLGSAEDLKRKYKWQIDKTVDLGLNTMFPGFVDSHMHLLALGLQLMRLDLSVAKSSVHMKELLIHKASELGDSQWLIGEGWNENQLPDRKIFHRKELDEISPDHPVALTRICRHAMIGNSRALEMAGIDAGTPDPPGGVIVKDLKDEPTGLLLDNAQSLLTSVIPSVSQSELTEACEKAVDHLVAVGLTGGHTEDLASYNGLKPTIDVYNTVLGKGDRRFRSHLLVNHLCLDDYDQEKENLDLNRDIELGAVKIFADGAFGGRTAFLREPYNDAPETSGVAIHEQEALADLVKKARDRGLAVAIHAIGDKALEWSLDAIEKYPSVTKLPDRIIHATLTPRDLRARLKNKNIILDIQPSFVPSDFPWVMERLGEARLENAYIWKTLLEEGLVCAGGSDTPIEYANPIIGIHAAVTREKPFEESESFTPGQCLSAFEAIQIYTAGSAIASGRKADDGKIIKGANADFTILNRDLLTCPKAHILSTETVMTVIGGQVVYDKENN